MEGSKSRGPLAGLAAVLGPTSSAPQPARDPKGDMGSRPGSAGPITPHATSGAASRATSPARSQPPQSHVVSDLVRRSEPGSGSLPHPTSSPRIAALATALQSATYHPAPPSASRGPLPAPVPPQYHTATAQYGSSGVGQPTAAQHPGYSASQAGWAQHLFSSGQPSTTYTSAAPSQMTAQQPSYHPPPQSNNRPAIMDPPGSQIIPQVSTSGFTSPGKDYSRTSSKFVEDVTRLTFAMEQSVPEAIRRVVRDYWEKCLLGTEFHHAFVMNAVVHQANLAISRRAMRDFGHKMVPFAKEEIVKHLSAADIDDIADLILAKASNKFFDRALNYRLKTIEARPLINALAKAERLGYDPGDILEEDQQRGQEHVIPHRPSGMHSTPLASGQTNGHQQPISNYSQERSDSNFQCSLCYRLFQVQSAFDYHMKRQVCTRHPPSIDGFKFSCPHCAQGFTTKVGLQYHLNNKICGDFSNQPGVAAVNPAINSLPGSPGLGIGHPQSITTMPPATAFTITPSAPRAGFPDQIVFSAERTPSNNQVGGPYAHLTPQKLDSMNEDLRDAEKTFRERIQQAEQISDTDERRARLEGLRNSFATKQSLIRKKYGVRLRERRSRAEIEEERQRMGLPARAQSSSRVQSSSPGPSAQASSAAKPAAADSPSAPSGVSTWTAANVAQDGKRRREDENSGDSPAQKRIAVADMGGGLNSSAATAATQDPTMPSAPAPTTSNEQAGARVQVIIPASRASSAPFTDNTSVPSSKKRSSKHNDKGGIKAGAKSEDSDDDTDDDDDIPAKLPAAVRKTLTPATRRNMPRRLP